MADELRPASTRGQALAAILFLYREVLAEPLPRLESAVRAKLSRRLPVVLGNSDVRAIVSYTHVPDRGGRGVLSPLDRRRGP